MVDLPKRLWIRLSIDTQTVTIAGKTVLHVMIGTLRPIVLRHSASVAVVFSAAP